MKDLRYRRSPKRDLRTHIIKRDRQICRYCGFYLKNKDKITLDHIVPYSNGGTTTADNLVVACRTCNAFKGNKTLEETGMQILNFKIVRQLWRTQTKWQNQV